MFNRHFEAGEDSLEFLFVHLTVKNMDFALISLSCILGPRNFDYTLYRDEHTFYFFHIQSVLTACGNISNVFYGRSPQLHNRNNAYRSTHLRNTFNITSSLFPLVFQKEVRNTNEHFDERFDSVRWQIGDYNILDNDTPTDMRETILNQYHLRTFDRTNGCYYTYGRRNHRLLPITYNFNELRNELLRMRELITTHQMFDSQWVDRAPEDILQG
jgi:hypothetical protein